MMDTANSLRNIVRIFFKRKWLLVSFFVATVATTVTLAKVFYEPVYRANSQLLLQVGREHIFDPTLQTAGTVRSSISFNTVEQINLAREVILGRTLAERVVDFIGVDRLYPALEEYPLEPSAETPREMAIREIRDQVEVNAVVNSTMLNIAFEHIHADVAASVVNTYVNFYLERHLEIRKNSQRDAFFKSQFEALETGLQKSETELRAFKVDNGISSTIGDEREKILLQNAKLEQEHGENELLIAEADRRLKALREQLKAGRSVTASGKIGRLFSPKVFEELQKNAVAAQVELGAGIARRNVMERQLAMKATKLRELDSIELQFNQLRQQVMVGRDNYNLYLTKFEESKISTAMDEEGIASIQVLEVASTPTKPEDEILRLAVVASVLFGLVGGIGLILFVEMAMPTIGTRNDVEKNLEIPVVACIIERPRITQGT